MKKMLFLILGLFFLITNVGASAGKLYFTESDGRLYYDSKLFDKKVFISNLDMVPGKLYNSQLQIENGTSTKYKLYFKVNEEEQSELAKELLDNIKMEIRLDGSLIYDGYANGLDYSKDKNGVNLQNAIYIGEYSKNAISKIDVVTKLEENYNNVENNELSRVEWEFYAVYDKEVIPINPDTGLFFQKDIIKVLIIILIICVLSFMMSSKVIQRNKLKINNI